MTPRIVFVSARLPWPCDSGLRERQFHLLSACARVGDVELVCFLDPGEDLAAARPLLAHCASFHPVPLARRRLEARLQALPPWRRRLVDWCTLTPSLVAMHESVAMQRAVTARARGAGLVFVSRLCMTASLGPLLGGPTGRRPRLVLDVDDVESVLSLRRARARRGLGALAEYADAARLARYERRVLPHFDRVLVCSDVDRERVGVPRAVVIPNGAPGHGAVHRPPPRAPVLIFCGSLGWLPNVDGLRVFVRDILPRIRAVRPDTRVLIVGRDPAPAVARLHDGKTITVVPSVPSVAPYYAGAAVAIVPLRIGGGTRLKILEAFGFRVPVVSTSIGCEGLAVESGRHLLVADRPRAFAEACVALLQDASLAEHLAGHAAALVASRYAWGTIENDMAAMLRGLLDEPQPACRPLVPTSGGPVIPVT